MFLSEFFRLLKIFSVIARYNLFELVDHFNVPRGLRLLKWCIFWRGQKYKHEPMGLRLRLAFEELGPVWIKFGQMLSTRRDLFPADIANQLALLQDNVAPFDGKIARQQIEEALNGSIEQWFDDFDETPLASASIAQVHCAKIKSTQENVVLKIIRPAVMSQIQADIRLMYRLAAWVPILMPDGQRLHATEVVHEYEKTLIDELDLRKEASNTIRLRNNFLNSELLYVPNVYEQFTRQNLMVSERIYGVPIADLETLREKGTNFKLLAERGVQTFFTQVFRDSFFHADMHPGNIFVNVSNPDDPQYIGIDCGIVGILTENDKRYLAENFLAFFNRDYNRIAHLYVSSGWVPEDTSIPEFEQAIRLVCEPVFAKPLSEISFGHLLVNLFQTARRFNMEVQPQLVLLEKTLLYIEGLGRQLYPQLDLWTTAKPFLEQWMEEQLGLKAMIKNVKQRLPYWSERLPELPDLLFETLTQHKKLQKHLKQQAEQQDKKQSKRLKTLFLFLIGCTFVISSFQLFTQGMIKSATYFIIIGIGIWIISWTRVK